MPRSLKARALQWLAQREHSRAELRRKLLAVALARAESAEAAGSAGSAGSTGSAERATSASAAAAEVEALLDALEADRYLCDARFVESRVHARAARFGDRRIREELRRHQLVLAPEAARALADSELSRARAVRERKFADWPADAAQRARQARFLAARGFSAETIGRALRPAPDSD